MNRYQAKAQEILLHNFQVMDLRDAPMSVWGLEAAIATALQESENLGLEKAAKVADLADCKNCCQEAGCLWENVIKEGQIDYVDLEKAIRALKGAE